MPSPQADFPASIAGSSRGSYTDTMTPISRTRVSARLGQSPLRTRPPITFNPVNAQSWVVSEESHSRSGSEESGALSPRPDALKENGRKGEEKASEVEVVEDPFEDYLHYESDRDYLSETGSMPEGDDEDEPIETIHFGSDTAIDRRKDELMRKPSVRTIRRDPPEIDAEEFPNSPSPYSPTPPTALPGKGMGSARPKTAGTFQTDAPSTYSRPSWRASQWPATAMPRGTITQRRSISGGRRQSDELAARESRWYAEQSRLRAGPGDAKSVGGSNLTNQHFTGPDMRSQPVLSGDGYETFHAPYEGPQVVDLPRRQPAFSTPIPVTTPEVALGLPSAAHNGSFGATAPMPRPREAPHYSPLGRFWMTVSPFVIAGLALLAAVLTTMTTRVYDTRIGSIYSVPNRVFSLTAAGDSPGDVKLGLEGWCLGEKMTNCTAYWDLAFGTAKDVAIPHDTTLRLADSAMLTSTVFAYLFASYAILTIVFQIWLFRALDLSWTFPTTESEETILRDIFTKACTRELREVYWCWWGHREGPIGHIFWLTSFVGGLVGFGSIVQFSKKLPECRLLPGAYLPLIVQVLMIPCTTRAVLYFFRIKENIKRFDRSLELLFPSHFDSTSDGQPSGFQGKTPAFPSHSQRQHHDQHQARHRNVGSTTSQPEGAQIPHPGPASALTTITQRRKKGRKAKPKPPGQKDRWASSICGGGSSFYSPEVLSPVRGLDEVEDVAGQAGNRTRVRDRDRDPEAGNTSGNIGTGIDIGPGPRAGGPDSDVQGWSDPFADQDQQGQGRSVVTPSNLTRSRSDSHSTSNLHAGSSSTSPGLGLSRSNSARSNLSSISDLGAGVNERWKKAYVRSRSLLPIIDRCQRQQQGDPSDERFILSEDGLLYIYLEEEGAGETEMEVPRLVPPEGRIRAELIEDAFDEVTSNNNPNSGVGAGGRNSRWDKTMVRSKVKLNLSLTFWWETLDADVDDFVDGGSGSR